MPCPRFRPSLPAFPGPRRTGRAESFPGQSTASASRPTSNAASGTSTRSLSYRTLWNGLKRIAAPYSEAEKDLLFRGTAARVYGIED